jgi:hypothetical protein
MRKVAPQVKYRQNFIGDMPKSGQMGQALFKTACLLRQIFLISREDRGRAQSALIL